MPHPTRCFLCSPRLSCSPSKDNDLRLPMNFHVWFTLKSTQPTQNILTVFWINEIKNIQKLCKPSLLLLHFPWPPPTPSHYSLSPLLDPISFLSPKSQNASQGPKLSSLISSHPTQMRSHQQIQETLQVFQTIISIRTQINTPTKISHNLHPNPRGKAWPLSPKTTTKRL